MSYEPPNYVRDLPDGCTLSVRVRPGARKNDVTGLHAGAVKISIAAPAIDGRANDALIAFLAELLKLPQSRVSIAGGTSGHNKLIRITGKSAAEVQAALFPVERC